MRRALSCVLLLLLSAPLALAAPERPSLRVALFDVAPYALSNAGRLDGIYVRLARELLAEAGLDARIELVPFARIPLLIGQDGSDMTISFATEALEAAAERLGTVMYVESLVVTSRARPASQLADLSGALIGRARGGCQDLRARDDLGLRWLDIKGFDNALKMLALGRLDGLCLTRDVLKHYAAVAEVERDSLGTEIVIGRRPVLVFVRKGLDAGTVDRLRNVLASRKPRSTD
ncbi:substrate-binding periplasmic protein [Roseateles violae]|uniref:Transporter substrate-binding domain-containing protein n=1 Tax=Roseateles violae TaxID=3058042 RepID=A0ABT8DPQ7_9BURK|nr:transporter substrate-binding domain-containing protein [Pelomonas sp. PFR6]MDN3920336.1 transporter substrate-binding domain-containing protein [Pelomonas sp. PFR6]